MPQVNQQNANTQAAFQAQQAILAGIGQNTSQSLLGGLNPIGAAAGTGATSAAAAAAAAAAGGSGATPAAGQSVSPSTASPSAVTTAAAGTADVEPKDFRLRLSPLAGSVKDVYGASSASNLLTPLYATNGLLFPYSPQIVFTQDVTYQDLALTHTISDYLAYTRTPSVSLSISGKFTVQTQAEGVYALACLHFLRVVSKMYFGQTDAAKAGLPPPILVLNGYGSYMFHQLRVVLKSHTFTYNETMDTVLVKTAGGSARLPALFDLGITLVVQQTPRAQKNVFSLEAFRTGALMLKGGWI